MTKRRVARGTAQDPGRTPLKSSSLQPNPLPRLAVWRSILLAFVPLFSDRGFVLLGELTTAWVLCPGRRTVTNMIRASGFSEERPHDAYHSFLRKGAWSLEALWNTTTLLLVSRLAPTGPVVLALDDTLFHRAGPKVEGAGKFRDAVRSTGSTTVYDRGLNLVVLVLRVKAPWGGEPLGLPLLVSLYRKKGPDQEGPTHLDLAVEMMGKLAAWLPSRLFTLVADGAYASLAGRDLPHTTLNSRIRRDANIFELPPPWRPGRVGRPPKKGKQLPKPMQLSEKLKKEEWTRVRVDRHGKLVERLVWAKVVLWYETTERPILLVISRDPAGREKDDYFFTTDVSMAPGLVVEYYLSRWCVECTFHDTKQSLGGEEPQTWKGEGPVRAASLAFWLHSLVWYWFLETQGKEPSMARLPWYPKKARPSFADALASLRLELWPERLSLSVERVSARSGPRALLEKTVARLTEVLAIAG